jgi:hypothetical protein
VKGKEDGEKRKERQRISGGKAITFCPMLIVIIQTLTSIFMYLIQTLQFHLDTKEIFERTTLVHDIKETF